MQPSLEKTKILYLKAQQVLSLISDGDNNSLEAVIARAMFDLRQLEDIKDFIAHCEDIGIQKTIKRAD